ITRFWTLSIGLRQHGEHGDAPPLRSPRNGSSPIATSLAWWIASERSATLKGEPVDLHGPFEGRRTRSCLAVGAYRVSVGLIRWAQRYFSKQCRSWAGGCISPVDNS